MDASRRMTAVDAQMLWMSAKIPNDQFLLYAFDGSPREVDAAIDQMRLRAGACDELRMRVVDDCAACYPLWVPGSVDRSQFVVHGGGRTWQACLDSVAELVGRQLDPHRMSWRAHVFPEVTDVPESGGLGTVVVVQMAHALGDGTRSAALAGVLLGRRAVPVSGPASRPRASLAARAVVASAEHRRLSEDLAAGLFPGPGRQRPLLSINQLRCGEGRFRTVVVRRDRLEGPTVTVAAMVGIAGAIAGYCTARGESVTDLGAEVPLASRKSLANNNFRNVGVGLHPGAEPAVRAARIVTELGRHRRRGRHPAVEAASAAFAAVPAPLLRWGVRQFDPSLRGPTLTGNTVVSSVNRGPADLTFGGVPVVFTAGFPGLSPMMSLTHGVHGIGDRIAVSVNADPGNLDIDEYIDRLRAALM